LSIFNDIVFSDVRLVFKMVGDTYHFDKLVFENPVVNLEATGTYVRNGEMDIVIQLKFVKSLDRIPLIGKVFERLTDLLGKVLSVRVRGTPDNPSLSPPVFG
jgi:hypothetical protein